MAVLDTLKYSDTKIFLKSFIEHSAKPIMRITPCLVS